MLITGSLNRWAASVDACPWGSLAGHSTLGTSAHITLPVAPPPKRAVKAHISLYTSGERQRRDASPWTLVQGVLAPIQFCIFLVSLALVVRYLLTGYGAQAALISAVVKTGALYTIMITGAIWERAVFGQYLFARAFFWEDVFSMLVLALHTLYIATLFSSGFPVHLQMLILLAAYAAYVINATQFLMKLRTARLEAAQEIPKIELIGEPG